MNNYDDVIDQLHGFGLQIQAGLVIDGRIKRVKTNEDNEQRGWYCLHEWQADDGNSYIVGSYGIWHGNENNAQKIELKKRKLTGDERASIRKRITEDKKRAKAARESANKRAAARAESAWRRAPTTKPAENAVDYLDRKEVQSYGLRYTESGSLIIPMIDMNRNIHGIQFILPSHHKRRQKTGRDKEYWPPGLAKQGHFYPIGNLHAASVVLLAEGYATGATAHAASGIPTAVAFDANNLLPVARSIRKSNPSCKILVLADDDYLTEEKSGINPGVKAASQVALELGSSCDWIKPVFPGDRNGKKLTDFNDLQHFPGGGLLLVQQQIQDKLDGLNWRVDTSAAGPVNQGSGESGEMPAMISVNDAVRRYWGTYGLGGDVLFDEVDRRLVHKKDVVNLLPRHGWDDLRHHPSWRVARDTEVGFDPTEEDPQIKCNLFAGWPTEPKKGECVALKYLLHYLCGNEQNQEDIFDWIMKWLAYPLQHRGAKMHSAIVIHGPQGTGKSRFFEAYSKIFGPYGRVLGQEALEDKFNADWAEKKLFILADEVLARTDMYHVKNRLKGFITGDTIRVNPKNLAAHNEKNQMNIVFLSNERMPLVLENDDRRHCVIWVPPKLDEEFFEDVNREIENGGIEALHYELLNMDLGDFKPWTKPPMTKAKADLINQAASSEERFIKEWKNLELESDDGETVPFCPCLGSHLYRFYERWCRMSGEIRPRPMNQFIGYLAKLQGWQAGASVRTLDNLTEHAKAAGQFKNRKMVIPSETAMNEVLKLSPKGSRQEMLMQRTDEPKYLWLTRGFFAFDQAVNESVGANA